MPRRALLTQRARAQVCEPHEEGRGGWSDAARRRGRPVAQGRRADLARAGRRGRGGCAQWGPGARPRSERAASWGMWLGREHLRVCREHPAGYDTGAGHLRALALCREHAAAWDTARAAQWCTDERDHVGDPWTARLRCWDGESSLITQSRLLPAPSGRAHRRAGALRGAQSCRGTCATRWCPGTTPPTTSCRPIPRTRAARAAASSKRPTTWVRYPTVPYPQPCICRPQAGRLPPTPGPPPAACPQPPGRLWPPHPEAWRARACPRRPAPPAAAPPCRARARRRRARVPGGPRRGRARAHAGDQLRRDRVGGRGGGRRDAGARVRGRVRGRGHPPGGRGHARPEDHAGGAAGAGRQVLRARPPRPALRPWPRLTAVSFLRGRLQKVCETARQTLPSTHLAQAS